MNKPKSYNKLPHFWQKLLMRLIPYLAIATVIAMLGIPTLAKICGPFLALVAQGMGIDPIHVSPAQLAVGCTVMAATFAALGAHDDMRRFHDGAWLGGHPSKNPSCGSARLISRPRDLKAIFRPWKKGEQPQPGIVVGAIGDGSGTILIDDSPAHTLLLGGTGSGKTTSCLLQSQISLGRSGTSTFTLDPKGEMSSTCWNALQDTGARVVMIDFSSPQTSDGWLPLQSAIECARGQRGREPREMMAELKTLASVLIPDRRESSSPIWGQAARMLFCGLAGFVVTSDSVPDECKNLSTVAALAAMPQNEAQAIVEKLPNGSPAKIALGSVAFAPAETYGGFCINLCAALDPFADDFVSPMLAKSDFRPEDFLNGQTCVFVKYNSATEAYHPLIAAFLETTIASLRRLAENECGGSLPIPIYFLLEELPQLPKISLGQSLAICRSQNMFFTCCMQSRAQLAAVYGKDAPGMFDNMGTTIFLQASDLETTRHYSDALGSYTVETTTKTRGGSVGSTTSRSTSFHEAKLFRPEDLARWNHEAGHLVLKGGKPYACASLPLSKTFIGDELGLCGTEADAAGQTRMAPERKRKNPDPAPVWDFSGIDFEMFTSQVAQSISAEDDPMFS